MEMPTLVADHNAEGHLQVLLSIWTKPDWTSFWNAAHCDIGNSESLAISHNESDEVIWKLCQTRGILLLTCNRNDDGDDSLEAVIRRSGTPTSLPVFTIADPDRVMREREYAERVAARLIEYIYDLDNMRGTGRLYVP
jgi:hypothetical protein